MSDKVWLSHPDHTGTWECPDGAVEDWKAIGWVVCDEPAPPVSPVVAENLAAQQAAADAQAKPTTKAATRGEQKEG
jgi:hypothetical protein